MKILIVNDDSIHAPGIALLAEAAMELSEVTVVAPARQCSAMSQRITIRETMNLRKAPDFPVPVKAAWQLEGMPADCVRVALQVLEEKPDFVFSGINAGWNAGFDIIHSGTLGAALEAVTYGVPAIAFSNAHDASLDLARQYLPRIARELTTMAPLRDAVWNVNFPACSPEELKGILTDRTVAPMPLFRERYIRTPRSDGSEDLTVEGIPLTAADPLPAGSDLEALLKGFISIGQVTCAVL